MWKGPGQDPGGDPDSGPPPGSHQEQSSELKDQFQQQEILIAQLKEMILKSEQSNVTKEKVDEYMNNLSKRGRTKRPKKDDNSKTLEIPASQKISLLRQQVEENRVKLAERDKSKRGLEEMVTQIKAQFDDPLHVKYQTPVSVPFQDSKEYSETSSAQELYTVLITKEKRITDLSSKIHKLESNVLDLQENLKEKDSVIDARTKAITLMTESLSRKGKTTLDALDDTKEQMKKMQENFISLEADMKARQMKLLDDLRLKNYEIAELQEQNGRLQKEIDESKDRNVEADDDEFSNMRIGRGKEENLRLSQIIMQHENTIKELSDSINQLKVKGSQTAETEVTRLRKQLDDSNKNMIKVKAQHKSKVKELTKKIEAFKKISDINAEIVKLETENSRLNQKIAELEEEKGSLQLKLVNSDSKGSAVTEHEKELKNVIEDLEKSLEEKDKVISILEGEISRTKNDNDVLQEKLRGMSHLENAQVTSEMASIQFEEQMDSLANENKKLMIATEQHHKEQEQLADTMELLKKEKQEMSLKLDHYIQENMELIDKLEKLSAEKVSSAESIEIVESLTQQEKLELAAYQKNIDIVAGNLKSSEENLPQIDLNESVNELTEETSELLQRIELFTVERREVMEKMEELKQENGHLNLKIKEVENNRDVLAETYEQLQNEKELLDTKLLTIEAENFGLKEKIECANNENQNESVHLHEQLQKFDSLQAEIDHNKTAIEEKQIELENLNSFVIQLQSQLNENVHENMQLNNNIIDLKRALADLENENKNLQNKMSQLEELKTNLSQLLDKNQEELETMSNAEWENRRLLESKDNEIMKLMKERDNTESVILDLQRTIKDKEEKFQKITSDFKEKYTRLQKQLEENSDNMQAITVPLERKVEELTTKNKEQLEKMKKIAASLKKKNQSYQELEGKFNETQIQHDTEMKTLLQQLSDLVTEVSRLRQDYDAKLEEVTVLEKKNVDLQNIITDLKDKADRNTEISLQQELLLTRENLGSIESSLQSKIQELELLVETQESELNQSRHRVNQLEESMSEVQDRKLSLEQRANQLGAELDEKCTTCAEMIDNENRLEEKLTSLTAHNENIKKKLEEVSSENQEVNEYNRKLHEKNDKLKKRIEQMMETVKMAEMHQQAMDNFESENEDLKKQIHNLENELRTVQSDYERTVEASKNDLDRINGDWQVQFDEVLKEKNELMMRCDIFEEELKQICEKESGFHGELLEYKTKLENSEAEIRDYEDRIHQLSSDQEDLNRLKIIIEDKDAEIEQYRKQEAPTLASFFDNIPSQHEPSVITKLQDENMAFRETISELQKAIEDLESKKTPQAYVEELNSLRQLIEDKDAEIENYCSQKGTTFFENIPSQDDPTVIATLQNEIATSAETVKELRKIIEDLELKKTEVVVVPLEELNRLQKSIEEKDAEIDNYRKQKTLTSFFDNETSREEPDVVRQLQLENAAYREKIKELRKTIEDLELKKTVEVAVDSVITEAQDRIQPQADIPTFVWAGQSNDSIKQATNHEAGSALQDSGADPFSFVVETSKGVPTENTNQELRDKIRTLEFMLFSVEKEKDEALLQCHELTNELTRLVYERETNTSSHLLPVTSVTTNEIDDLRPLKESSVLEDAVQARDYFRFDQSDIHIPVESQIIPPQDVVDTPQTRQELHQIEFEKARSPVFSTHNQVQEQPCSAKEAYVCTLNENDDGWGCCAEEAQLEEEHAQKPESTNALRERLRVLELERENHLEEIRQLQVKSGKLIKKLKEFKAKNEELTHARKKSDADLFSLDDTIQEELKLQIQQVEKRLKDTASELEKEKSEKNAVLKRVDVLTAANERMVEMKEKQDVELMGWQHNYRELSAKLERFEWGSDGFASVDHSPENKPNDQETNDAIKALNKKIDELNETIRDLYLDNEELQTLLEEQRTLRIEADKSRAVEITPADYSEVVRSRDSLSDQLKQSGNEKRQVLDQLNELIKRNAELADSFNALEKQNGELTALTNSKNEIITNLNDQLVVVEGEKEILFKELQEKNVQINSLREPVDGRVATLRSELDTQGKSIQAFLEENKILTDTVSAKDSDIEKMSITMEQMIQEWEIRVDQRGNDVAESWKLHLEARETEFSQSEQLLKKEINELEEKINALVNENNELRKNVDAEIRNEVDRVAALQQQINDRQLYINDLTRMVQDKQGEVEVLKLELQAARNGLEEEKEIVNAVLDAIQEHDDVTVARSGESLAEVFVNKGNQVVSLKKDVKDLSCLREDLLTKQEEMQELDALLEERNQTIATLTGRLQEVQNLKDYENENSENLQQHLIEFQEMNAAVSAHLQVKTAQAEESEREINNLRLVLEEKQREREYTVESLSQEYRSSKKEQAEEIEILKRRLHENENRYEELLAAKDSDLEGVHLELKQQSEVATERSQEIENLWAELSTKVEECASLQRKIDEENVLVDEENKQLTELRAIIEDQVFKIEELKKNLFEKSNDYDSLIAEVDISRTNVENEEAHTQTNKQVQEDDLTEPVRRAELDLALYMLHQRDVRCEELTVELTQLLEERDTLQLRLSNALREKEELWRKTKSDDAREAPSSETASEAKSGVSVEVVDTLTNKLSELRTVGYKKDKTIVDQQEMRRRQELSIMQQHRDVASMLPPEAAARLVDASYTLSRDVQSPSKVLLNWLWGRSTPKVNNV